jgi:hypothetical protein
MIGGRPSLSIRQAVRQRIGWRGPAGSRQPSANPLNHARRFAKDRSRVSVIIVQVARYPPASSHGSLRRASHTRFLALSRQNNVCLLGDVCGCCITESASYLIR